MKFHISPTIFDLFPGLHIGVLVVRAIHNFGGSPEIQTELRKREAEIRMRYTLESIIQEPKIEVWRKAYASFGVKPKEHWSSVENLHRLILEGKEIRHVNQFVDIYNLISLRHMLPVGAEDLDAIQGDLTLDFAASNETSALLLGDKERRAPHEGEVIYKDYISFMCRRFNWREADRTKLTESTKNCIAIIEGLPPVTEAEVSAALEDLKKYILKHCGGSIMSVLLNERTNEVKI